MRSTPPDDASSRETGAGVVAAGSLVGLAALSPWPFGGVSQGATGIISALAAAFGCGACVVLLRRQRAIPSVSVVWLLSGLLALGLLQLVPLPPPWHVFLAPGSAGVWHPADPAAAEVLGTGARPVSIHPEATRRALAFATALLGLGVLSAPALARRRPALVVAVAIALAGFATAGFGIVSHLVFANRLYGQLAVPTVAPFGSFVSKNHFAGYVEMAALLTLGLARGLADEARRSASALSWIENRRAGRVLAAFGAAATMALAVLVSQSRGGALALASGLLCFDWLRWFGLRGSGWKRALVGLLGLTVAALLAFLVLPHRSQERLRGLSRATQDSAGAFRLGTWKDTLGAGRASPTLGWGLGTFADALPPYKTSSGELRIEHAENDYLELLAEGGLAGLGLAVAALALWAWGMAKACRTEESRLHAALAAGAASGIVALAVHGLVDFNLRIPSNALLFSLLAALTAGSQLRCAALRPAPVPAGAVALALGAAFLWSGLLAPRAGRPDVAFLRDRAAVSLRARQMETALQAHLQTRPADAEAWALLGWLRAERGSPAQGAALARHGARLDPQRKELVTLAERLSARSTAPLGK